MIPGDCACLTELVPKGHTVCEENDIFLAIMDQMEGRGGSNSRLVQSPFAELWGDSAQ